MSKKEILNKKCLLKAKASLLSLGEVVVLGKRAENSI